MLRFARCTGLMTSMICAILHFPYFSRPSRISGVVLTLVYDYQSQDSTDRISSIQTSSMSRRKFWNSSLLCVEIGENWRWERLKTLCGPSEFLGKSLQKGCCSSLSDAADCLNIVLPSYQSRLTTRLPNQLCHSCWQVEYERIHVCSYYRREPFFFLASLQRSSFFSLWEPQWMILEFSPFPQSN